MIPEELSQISKLLIDYHDVLSLGEEDRGETNLVEFEIKTGSASPVRQAARRIPFAARQEIAK